MNNEDKVEILLDVKVDTTKVAKQMAEATNQVRILKQEQKLLTKAFEEGTIADVEYAKAMAESKAELEKANRDVKSYTALLQAETIARVDDTMSLDEQRQALNAAQKAYAALSGEEKIAADSEGGLRDQINALSDSVKKQEAAIGDARRNVGNYAGAIKDAASQMGSLGTGLVNATSKMQQAKSVMTVIAAHPLIALLSVLVFTFKKIGDALKNNAAAMESLTGAMGAFAGVGNIVNTIVEKIAQGIGWVAEKALALADKFGALSDKVKDGIAIAKEDIEIQKAQREAALQNAEDAQKVAQLREKATNKEKYSASERLKFLKQANAIEEQVAQRSYDLAKREYELQVKKNAQSKSSQADLKKENDLEIAMLNAKTALFNKQKELNSQVESARQEEIANERAAAAARLEVQRALEDSLLAVSRDATEKAITQAQLAGQREVENLRIKLNNLKETDIEGRELLQQLIIAKEKETEQKVTDIATKAAYEREQKIRENARTQEEIGVTDAIELAQLRYDAAQEDYNRIINLSQAEKDALYATQEDYNAAVIEAQRASFEAQEALATEQYEERKLRTENEFAERLAQAEENDVLRAQIEYERAVAENEELLNLDAETKARLFATQAEYEAAVIASNENVAKSNKKAIDAQRQMAIANAQAVGNALGAMSGLLDKFGEENKAAAILSKGIALGKIAVETGVAIAGGIAQAQSVPFPANIAAIATTVATVLSNIATAVETVKSAKFAHGGIVEGTSYTGDKVPVMANSREMYLNLEQQTRLFDWIAGNGSEGFGFNYDLMAEAIKSLPAPVLDYKEFNDFEDRVASYEEIASI